jgi:hypothetical protein
MGRGLWWEEWGEVVGSGIIVGVSAKLLQYKASLKSGHALREIQGREVTKEGNKRVRLNPTTLKTIPNN